MPGVVWRIREWGVASGEWRVAGGEWRVAGGLALPGLLGVDAEEMAAGDLYGGCGGRHEVTEAPGQPKGQRLVL